MVEDKNLELLKSLGFSERECSIYFSLLERREGESIDKILVGLGVPPPEAEEAVERLVEKGLVRVVSNRLEASPPREFLAKVVEEKRRRLEEEFESVSNIALTLQRALEPLYWEKRLGVRPEEIIEPLESLEAMEARTAEVIANAEREVFIFAETFGWYEKIRGELLKALDRGVKVKVLMMALDESSSKRAGELKRLGVEVKHCVEEWYPVRGTLADDKELLFLIWATKKRGIARPVYYRPHYTRNAGLIRIFADAFMKRWEKAKNI